MMHKRAVCTVLGLLVLVAGTGAFGKVRLPRLISDGMVLQRDAGVRVWGWASPGEQVTVRFVGTSLTATATTAGEWEVVLPPMPAGGPYSMEIEASNHVVVNDVLIGDVWICSGQSNMVLPVERVRPLYEEAIARADNPFIRHFAVPQRVDFAAPQNDLARGQWEAANPWTVVRFTATGYFFARTLWERYHVPIGLINASVGGTPIQSWMSREALKEFPAGLETARRFADGRYADSIRSANEAASDAWYGRVRKMDKGLNGPVPWFDAAFDDSAWPTMELPGYWSDHGLKSVNGVVWFRRSFSVPAELAGISARLLLGRIVDADFAYVNGVFVGSTSYQYPPRRYTVAPGVLRAGANVIAVRVINTGGKGGFSEGKPYEVRIGDRTISLAGPWRYAQGVATDPLPGSTVIDYQPVGLFNGMIAPLLQTTIKGVLWYQGESNTGQPAGYGKMLTSMIADWRSQWKNGDFTFLCVQLPNYGPSEDEPSESGTAEVRAAQLAAAGLPNTGVAVTIDLGEGNDLHPMNKGEVGRRLALLAERIAYGEQNIVSSGPMYHSMSVERDEAVITFTGVGSGLVAGGGGPLRRFEISGDGRVFVRADARIVGMTVVVRSPAVPHPIAVRYAWADNPTGANLYNAEGLPASPFTTWR
jgi:sialate O-acetylesterase